MVLQKTDGKDIKEKKNYIQDAYISTLRQEVVYYLRINILFIN